MRRTGQKSHVSLSITPFNIFWLKEMGIAYWWVKTEKRLAHSKIVINV